MNINDAFASKYLKAADLQGRSVRVKIQDVVTEKVGDDLKFVLYFVGKQKGMICNRTNGMTIGEVFGPETDNWRGGEIELFSMKVPFQGKLTDALRVRPLIARQAPAQRPVQMAPNARDRAMVGQDHGQDDGYRGDDVAPAASQPASRPQYEELDDEIPF